MKFIDAVPVSTGNLTTNVTDPTGVWNTGSYSVGNEVQRAQGRYRAKINNTNKDPLLFPDVWFYIGPTNDFAMFDNKTGTQSTRDDNITTTVIAGKRADSIALINVSAADVTITVNDGVSDVYNEEISMVSDDGIVDWWSYFFDPIVRETDVYRDDLPNISNPIVTVSYDAPGATVKVGQQVIGWGQTIGVSLMPGRLGINDYSRIEVDDFGNYGITQRGYAKTGDFTAYIDNVRINAVFNMLAAKRATPIVFIGIEKFSSSLMFGILKEWNIEMPGPYRSLVSVSFQGI